MPSTPINTIVHSVLTKSRKKLIMAAIMSNALMAWAFNTKRVEFEDGGKDITNPITLGRNPNVTSTEYYNQIPVAQTDEFSTLRYGWSRVVGSVIISDQEEDEEGDSEVEETDEEELSKSPVNYHQKLRLTVTFLSSASD